MTKNKQIIIDDFYKIETFSNGQKRKRWYFKVIDSNGQDRIFKRDKRIKQIKNFKTQESASKEALINYYSRRDNTVYEPTKQDNFNNQLDRQYSKIQKRKSINKNIKTFKNENKIIFANKQKLFNYDFMYIHVTVKVWLDGVWTYARQRGDYYYKQEFPNGVPRKNIENEIRKACLRAIAPFGSNVKFNIINWQFAYHQRKGFEYGEKSVYYGR